MKRALLTFAFAVSLFLTCAPSFAQGLNPFGTTVFYGNGVDNDRPAAIRNQIKLEERLTASLAGNPNYDLSFELVFNQTEGLFLDLYESLRQKIATIKPKDFYLAMNSIAETEDQQILLQEIGKLMPWYLSKSLVPADLSNQVAAYNRTHDALRRVLIVSHSQGNLFANDAIRMTRSDYLNSIANMQVTSASSETSPALTWGHEKFRCDVLTIGLAATASCPTPNPQLTDIYQEVRRLTDTQGGSGVPTWESVWCPAPKGTAGDCTWHGFKEVYLNIPEMRDKILGHISGMLANQSFKFPLNISAVSFKDGTTDVTYEKVNGTVSFSSFNYGTMKLLGLGLGNKDVEVALVNSVTQAKQILLAAGTVRSADVTAGGRDSIEVSFVAPLPERFYVEISHTGLSSAMARMSLPWDNGELRSQEIITPSTPPLSMRISDSGGYATGTLSLAFLGATLSPADFSIIAETPDYLPLVSVKCDTEFSCELTPQDGAYYPYVLKRSPLFTVSWKNPANGLVSSFRVKLEGFSTMWLDGYQWSVYENTAYPYYVPIFHFWTNVPCSRFEPAEEADILGLGLGDNYALRTITGAAAPSEASYDNEYWANYCQAELENAPVGRRGTWYDYVIRFNNGYGDRTTIRHALIPFF